MYSIRIHSIINAVFIYLCCSTLAMAIMYPAMAKPLSQKVANREEAGDNIILSLDLSSPAQPTSQLETESNNNHETKQILITQKPEKIRGISHYLKIRQKDISHQEKESESPVSSQIDHNSDMRQDAYHFQHLKSATELLKKKSVDERPVTPINRYIFLDSRRDRHLEKDGVHHSSKRVGVPSSP